MTLKLACVALAFGTLVACEDEHSHPDAVDIAIAAPLDGATVAVGAAVAIDVTVTADAALHGWEIVVRNAADDSELESFDAHEHAATYAISEVWTANVAAGTAVEIEVLVTGDHDSPPVTEKISITVE